MPGVPNTLEQLTDQAETLDAMIGVLDRSILALLRRIEALEQFRDDHQAGAQRRQQEVDRLTAENQRLRYTLRTGRQA